MNERDRSRLQDMLLESQKLQQAISGKTRSDLEDYLTANGISHAIALIGEAASQISEVTRDQYPHIKWSQIIGMRNFLIHQYRRVDTDVIWQTATINVAELVNQLEKILSDD